VRRPAADRQVVERHAGVGPAHLPVLQVDLLDLPEHDVHVLLAAEDPADRERDVRRGQRGRRHLVQQRLEQVVVVLVDEDHVDRAAVQLLHQVDPGEPGTDHDQTLAWGGRRCHVGGW
jgi:hypothetical protein